MKSENSKLFYKGYQNLKNKKSTVTIKAGRAITGNIIALQLNDDECTNPEVVSLHIVEEDVNSSTGIDCFGYLTGEIIKLSDVSNIYFFENKTTIMFL